MLASLTTTVAGDAATGCVWLETEVGDRLAVLWPRHYRARFDPVRVYDQRDRLVLTEGTFTEVGGGHSPVGIERIPRACRVGGSAWHMPPLTRP